jgi:hypothetical protein
MSVIAQTASLAQRNFVVIRKRTLAVKLTLNGLRKSNIRKEAA